MEQTKKTRPNIVLIMTDEMRGDCMGIAGHPDVKTPYIDSLAAKGVYYPNAYSLALPVCQHVQFCTLVFPSGILVV